VDTTRILAQEADANGLQMIDAPVSGGAEGAAAGTLSFMVGGNATAYEAALPVLNAMGSKVAHFGASGAGQAAKACHNMICGITALGVCEAFALADGLGLDAARFFSLCQGAAAQSWILENRCPVPGPAAAAPASNDYAPGFAARLMAKDLRLGQKAAEACGQSTPFGAEAARRFTEFAEAGGGDLDFSAIYRTIRRSD
jgi:3-hydroxyisobutyrate dehydrogenase